ncbi:MAG: terminase small subunit [Gallionella sp.]|nr:terminase small subunit [Gallionella sp.]
MAKKKPKTPIKKVLAKASDFVEEYLKNGRNGTRAYMKVYPDITNPETAKVAASRLLTNVHVSTLLSEREEEIRAKYRLTTDDVMRSLSQRLHFNPKALYKDDGSLKPVTELDDDTVMALSGLEVVEMAGGAKIGGGEGVSHVPMYHKKLKWHDKNVTSDQVMKHLGMYAKDKDPVTPPAPVNVTLKLSPREAYMMALNGPSKAKSRR